MKISIQNTCHASIGVGVLFAREHEVTVLSSDQARADLLNQGVCPIDDEEIAAYMAKAKADGVDLRLRATTNREKAFEDAEYVIVSLIPSMNVKTEQIDTTDIERSIADIRAVNREAWILVQAHVPVGFTERLAMRTRDRRLLFSPDFIEDDMSFSRICNPPRVVIGAPDAPEARAAAERLIDAIVGVTDRPRARRPRMVMTTEEAEALMLLERSTSAIFIGLVNSIDTYCVHQGLDSHAILEALISWMPAATPAPSLGCEATYLPSNIKRFLSQNPNFPKEVIDFLVEGDASRQDFIASEALRRIYRVVYAGKENPVLGIYLPSRAGCTAWATNFVTNMRQNSRGRGVSLAVYDPAWPGDPIDDVTFVDDLDEFKASCDVIVSSNLPEELEDVREKVYTRSVGR